MKTLCLVIVGLGFFSRRRISMFARYARVGLLLALCVDRDASGQHIKSTNTPLAPAFRDYTEEDGLSNTYVTSFYQDDFGFVWMSTAGGLERFDGYEFRLIPSIAGDSTSLSHKNGWSVDGDHEGNLWIGTSHGVNRYDPLTGKITRFYHDPSDTSSITSNFVRKVLVDSNGDVWIGSDNGLSRYDSERAEFHQYLFRPGQAQRNIRAIAEDASRNIWFAVSDTLYGYSLDRESMLGVTYPLPASQKGSLIIRVMTFDGDSLLWLGTDRAGVFAFDVHAREFVRHFDSSSEANLHLMDDQVNALVVDHDKSVWIGTMDGFHLYTPATGHVYRPSSSEAGVSTSKEIWSLFTDKAGNVWVGSFYGGVRVWLRHAKRFGHFDTTSLGEQDANSTIVQAFARSPEGDVLFVVGGTTLMRWHTKEQRVSKVNVFIPSIQIIDILYDRNGDFWVFTGDKGLFLLDQHSGNATSVLTPDSPCYDQISDMMESGDGDLWIGTLNGVVCRFTPEENSVRIYYLEQNTSFAVGNSNGSVSAVYEDDCNCSPARLAGLNIRPLALIPA